MSLAKGVGRLSDMIMTRGSGSWIYTSDNKKLLDFTCGIAVTNLGHCHPRITNAIAKQAQTLIHGQINISFHQPMLDLIEKLKRIVPNDLNAFFFATTGAEAVENAVKLARQVTNKQNIVVMDGGYHGRTIGAMSLTSSKTIYRAGYGPLMSGVSIIPYPYAIHGPINDEENNAQWCLDQLKHCLITKSAPEETAALLIEPVLGEGGYVVPPKTFLKRLLHICKENNILLICDEVQSGFGRTGSYFTSNSYFGITPDILVMAKGIANGLPLSGFVTRKELTDVQRPGSMGGTFAGNAVACAAAIEIQNIFMEENILDNVKERSYQIIQTLKSLQNCGKYPILEVRGIGLMIAVEFKCNEKFKGIAQKISQICLKNGLILLTTSIYDTLRFMPPLNSTQEEIEIGMNIFKQSLNEVFLNYKNGLSS